ncbi:MAG: hypothetical protein WCI73_17725, partial [Phycisphaerae bacterium]
MTKILKWPLTDKTIDHLWSHPKQFASEYGKAIRENRRDNAAELALTFGQMFCETGAARVALDILMYYLKKWEDTADEHTGEIMSLAGNAAGHLGDHALAERLLQHLVQLASANDWLSLHRRALQTLGVLRHDQGRLQERDRLYRDAMQIAEQSRDRLGEAQLYNNMGAAALDAGSMKEGERLIRKSIYIKDQLGCELDAARSRVTLGGHLARQRRFGAATKLLVVASRVGVKYHDHQLLATVIYNRGMMAIDTGRIQKAPALLKVALQRAT